jgi:hypothetical protein
MKSGRAACGHDDFISIAAGRDPERGLDPQFVAAEDQAGVDRSPQLPQSAQPEEPVVQQLAHNWRTSAIAIDPTGR